MPSLLAERYNCNDNDNKIFALGSGCIGTTCETLDLNDDDLQWRYIAQMNSGHYGGALIMERKIYALGGTKFVYTVKKMCF